MIHQSTQPHTPTFAKKLLIMRKTFGLAVIIIAAALAFRLLLVTYLPVDDDDDGRYYAQLAHNLIEGRGYSGETEEPFVPTYVRTPGYPLFIAATYKLFGEDNTKALHLVQCALDVATCCGIALLAAWWSPRGWTRSRRNRVMLAALAIAALCPFTAVYVTTTLSESLALFLVTGFVLVVTRAIERTGTAKGLALFLLAGLLGSAAAMVRPDSALFVGAASLTVFLLALRANRNLSTQHSPLTATQHLARAVGRISAIALGFAIGIAPWTIRNAVVFGVFQPAAPLYANMPNEFLPAGYIAWLRTWVDDERYVSPFEDGLNQYPIDVEALPHRAFDSPAERDRVAELLERYNNRAPAESEEPQETEKQLDSTEDKSDDSEQETPPEPRMTPEIDSGFAELARDRINRHPVRYYVVLPARKAIGLWFDTHSQSYPFQGQLLPLYDMDFDHNQHYWLGLFVTLIWALTVFAFLGVMLMIRDSSSRRWCLLLLLLIVPRLVFLAAQEHPEGRYTAEFFPIVIAVASVTAGYRRRATNDLSEPSH